VQPQGGCPVLGRHRQQRPGGGGHGQRQHLPGVVAVQRPQPKPGQDGRVPHPVKQPIKQRSSRPAPELEPGYLPVDPVGD
jgi:hypothetical protein